MPRKKKRVRSKSAISKAMLKQLDRERDNLVQVRDNLRTIAEDAHELSDNADDAVADIESAIATLCKYI